MKRSIPALLCLAGLLLLHCGKSGSPYDLKYPPLSYDPPRPQAHRHVLQNGITAYIVEDQKLPVFDLRAVVRTGGLLDPAQKEGLAVLTATLLRSGGTAALPADSLDELLDFHAISLSSGADMTGASVSLSVLAEKTETGLSLFCDVLQRPAFEQAKLDLAKAQLMESIRHRMDHPKAVLGIMFDHAVYGHSRLSSLLRESEVNQITRKDVQSFYAKYYRPENVILAVSGRFKTKEMLALLNRTLGAWQKSGKGETVMPDVPFRFDKKHYFVEKESNQAYVRLGLPLIRRPHPDYYTLTLMNWVLGGAAFTSRISKKVREYEGLAYHAGSSVNCGYFFPGTFNVYLETKSASAAYAISLVFGEIRTFLESGARAEELEAGKKTLIDAFPAMFKTGDDIADAFAYNQYYKRADDHFDVYRDKIRAITLDDLKRVAEKYIRPDQMAICIVGQYADCEKGDNVHPPKLADYGGFTRLSEKELQALCEKRE